MGGVKVNIEGKNELALSCDVNSSVFMWRIEGSLVCMRVPGCIRIIVDKSASRSNSLKLAY